jgi:hypothetical protein
MSIDGSTWFGAVTLAYPVNDPGSVDGTWSWSIRATDARGNSATRSGSTTLANC